MNKRETCKIKTENGWLVLTMPNGETIPFQKDLVVKQSMEQKGFVHAEVTLNIIIPIADFELITVAQLPEEVDE